MKKSSCIFLLVAITVALLSGCSHHNSNVNPYSAVKELTEKFSYTAGELYTSDSGQGTELDEDAVLYYYGEEGDAPDFSKVEKYAVYLDDSNPKTITDVGIFVLNDESYCDTFKGYITSRISDKIKIAKAYPDVDLSTLNKAKVESKGNCVYYAVSPDSEKILKEIEEKLEG